MSTRRGVARALEQRPPQLRGPRCALALWTLAIGVNAGCTVDDGALGAAAGAGAAGEPATVATVNACLSGGVLLKGRYDGDITLSCPDYLIDGDVSFEEGTLTIQPGVRFRMGLAATFWVGSEGALIAKGTAEKPIVFRGAEAEQGHWRAFVIESINPGNALHYVTIQHGGRETYYTTEKAGLTLKGKVAVSVEHCTFAANGGSHLYVDDQARLTSFVSNTFGTQDEAALHLPTAQAGVLDAASDFGPAGNFVQVRGRAVKADTRWQRISRPRRLSGNHQWDDGTWTVDPGVDIELELGATLWVGEKARVDIAGTAAEPVVMRGSTAQPGHWRAFVIESIDPANRVEGLDLRHGGADTYYTVDPAGLILKGKAWVAIKHSVFRENAGVGLWVDDTATLAGFAANTFAANVGAGLYVHSQNVQWLDSASSYGATAKEYVYVKGGSASGGGTWPKTDRPLRLFGDHNLQKGTFVFAPGAHLQLDTGATLWVDTGASLVAKGTAAAPIVIEGAQALAGAWRAFVIESPELTNELAFVTIRHGGGDTYYSSQKAGLYLKGKASLALHDCTFAENGEFDLVAEAGVKLAPVDPAGANSFVGKVLLK